MQLTKQYKLILLLFLILPFACVDEIDLETESVDTELLIIDGSVFSNGDPPVVKIRKSADFASGPDGVENPVSGATVIITEIGGAELELAEFEPGVYSQVVPFGEAGKQYKLTVDVFDNTYESLVETMPVMVPIESLNYTTKVELSENAAGNPIEQDIFVLRANTNIPQDQGDIFLRYRIDGVYEYRERISGSNPNAKFCWITEAVDFNNVAIIDGNDIQDGVLIDQPILDKLIDHRMAFNYCYTVIQMSISENTYNFWEIIKNEFERTGDIFESPPAIIKGNVFNTVDTRQDVIGIFSAIATDSLKINVNGLDIGAPRGQCQGFGFTLPDACSNCLILQNSTTVQPECM